VRRPLARLLPYAVFGGLLVLWQAGSETGRLNPLLFPAPSRIVTTLVLGVVAPAKAGYAFPVHLAHSLALLSLGFTLGSVAGIGTGIAAGLSTIVYRLFSPVLGFVTPIPAIAWTPVAMVWIGIGNPTILAIVALACFSEVVFNTITGVRSIPRLYLWQARSLGADRKFIFWHVLLPAGLPGILVGIRLGLAASWRALIGAEMFGGVAWGLGFLLFDAKQFYATDAMFAALLLVVAFSLVLEQGLLRRVERFTIERWGLARTLEA
jgi:taurine transport system permease protein